VEGRCGSYQVGLFGTPFHSSFLTGSRGDEFNCEKGGRKREKEKIEIHFHVGSSGVPEAPRLEIGDQIAYQIKNDEGD
jgi:hypothetical protein